MLKTAKGQGSQFLDLGCCRIEVPCRKRNSRSWQQGLSSSFTLRGETDRSVDSHLNLAGLCLGDPWQQQVEHAVRDLRSNAIMVDIVTQDE